MKNAEKEQQNRAKNDLTLRASSVWPNLLFNRRYFCVPLAENFPKHEAIHNFSIHAALKRRKSLKITFLFQINYLLPARTVARLFPSIISFDKAIVKCKNNFGDRAEILACTKRIFCANHLVELKSRIVFIVVIPESEDFWSVIAVTRSQLNTS